MPVPPAKCGSLPMLEGKVALIVGSGQGMGAATAARMAQAGAEVILANRTLESAEGVAADIRSTGGKAEARHVDVSARASVQSLVDSIAQSHGTIDIVVQNAAYISWKPLLEIDDNELERMLSVNLKSCFLLTQAVAPLMIKNGKGGRIIVTSSITGPKVAMPGSAHYAASKGGVNAFIRAAALELAPFAITVNGVEPGFIAKPGRGSLSKPETRARIERYIPLGAMGEPDDIAHAMLYLASPHAKYVTGQILTVDGGAVLPETGYAMERLRPDTSR
jgi:3-oxoacyl-[acyl-carrier protein] reductase